MSDWWGETENWLGGCCLRLEAFAGPLTREKVRCL